MGRVRETFPSSSSSFFSLLKNPDATASIGEYRRRGAFTCLLVKMELLEVDGGDGKQADGVLFFLLSFENMK